MQVTKLIIEDVRCFKGKHEFDIKPLTFITGGNSSGKSTILACWQVLANFLGGGRLDFNTYPYLMGSFDNIARKSRPKTERFSIGFEIELDTKGDKNATYRYILIMTKHQSGSEPVATKECHTLRYGDRKASLPISYEHDDAFHLGFTYRFGARSRRKAPETPQEGQEFLSLLRTIYEDGLLDEILPNPNKVYLKDNWRLFGLMQLSVERLFDATSIAPLRAEPQRTYDPIQGTQPTQGDDIPMLLRDLLKNKKLWSLLQTNLNDFGKEAGMFEDIRVKHLGDSDSRPFQIEIKPFNSPMANLIDVGYGTSQILPILMRALSRLGAKQSVFLIQQPEVHLHPQAQAALSSFLVSIISARNNRKDPSFLSFVAETHSDYMIDRARIEVMKQHLAPEDLAIIYLESKPKDGVKATALTIDAQGNLLNPPDGYRNFFLHETNKLLGF